MLSGILFIIIIISVLVYFNKNNNDLENVLQNKKYNETISMMLETASGSGEYEKTTASEWPAEGYIFNSELSKCENGGELSWDDTRKVILMTGNMSDKCYIYFDKLILPTITASVTEVTDSTITINSTSKKGTFDVNKYYYSKDNGTTFTESNSNTYTFSSLDDSTTYNIAVYADDTKGNKSTIYKLTGTTKSSKPVINSVTIDDYYTDEAIIIFNITYTSKDTITEVYASENGTSYKKCTYDYGKYSCYTSKRYCKRM